MTNNSDLNRNLSDFGKCQEDGYRPAVVNRRLSLHLLQSLKDKRNPAPPQSTALTLMRNGRLNGGPKSLEMVVELWSCSCDGKTGRDELKLRSNFDSEKVTWTSEGLSWCLIIFLSK